MMKLARVALLLTLASSAVGPKPMWANRKTKLHCLFS